MCLRFFVLCILFAVKSWATLILVQPTINGFVACGDHRLMDPVTFRIHDDTVEKIAVKQNGVTFSLQETLLTSNVYGRLSLNDEVEHFFSGRLMSLQTIQTFTDRYRSLLENL